MTDAEPDRMVELYARLLREEIDALLAAAPAAFERQWDRSPAPRPREDTNERSKGSLPADPTADTALDPRRLALRATVHQLTEALRSAAVTARGARLALENAVQRFDGTSA